MANEDNSEMTEKKQKLQETILCSSQLIFNENILGTSCCSSKLDKICFLPSGLSSNKDEKPHLLIILGRSNVPSAQTVRGQDREPVWLPVPFKKMLFYIYRENEPKSKNPNLVQA